MYEILQIMNQRALGRGEERKMFYTPRGGAKEGRK